MNQEKRVKYIDWGDGHIVKVPIPNLSQLKGVFCPAPCNPIGEDPDWGYRLAAANSDRLIFRLENNMKSK